MRFSSSSSLELGPLSKFLPGAPSNINPSLDYLVYLDGVKVSLHDTYPITKPIPHERRVFKDLPQDASNNAILESLKDHPGINVKSDIIFSRMRAGDIKLNPFCT